MICPHCEYEHIIDHPDYKGKKFYSFPNNKPLTEGGSSAWGADEMYLYGCPQCRKTFIDYCY